MKRITNELIDRIRDKGMYGVFIEAGCAGIVSHLIQMEPGASKIVYASVCPYSKDFQELEYGITERSVSSNAVTNMVDTWLESNHAKNESVNFVYSSSFQIGDVDGNIVTHGWICFFDKIHNRFSRYHITLPSKMRRATYIEMIGDIGLHILYAGVGNVPRNCYIDNMNTIGIGVTIEKDRLNLLDSIIHSSMGKEQVVCFDGGRIIRLEDLYRKHNELIVYKGSFNPLHNVHLEFAETVETRTGVRPVFSISLDTYEKGEVDGKDLLQRIRFINDLGYAVIVINDPYFADLYLYLDRDRNMPNVRFMLGSDTFKRITTSTHQTVDDFKSDFNRAKFIILERDNHPSNFDQFIDFIDFYIQLEDTSISSTQVRNLLSSGDIEGIEKLVPPEVYQHLKTTK